MSATYEINSKAYPEQTNNNLVEACGILPHWLIEFDFMVQKGIKKGLLKGKLEGSLEKAREAAAILKKANISLDIICQSTGLTEEDIEKL